MLQKKLHNNYPVPDTEMQCVALKRSGRSPNRETIIILNLRTVHSQLRPHAHVPNERCSPVEPLMLLLQARQIACGLAAAYYVSDTGVSSSLSRASRDHSVCTTSAICFVRKFIGAWAAHGENVARIRRSKRICGDFEDAKVRSNAPIGNPPT